MAGGRLSHEDASSVAGNFELESAMGRRLFRNILIIKQITKEVIL